MKTLIGFFLVFIVVQTLFAQQDAFSAEKKSAVVNNLNAAITSDNTGLQTSGAVVLSNLICDSYLESSDASLTMIPLLKMLKEGKTSEERISAAVALYQLGNGIGIYSLRGVAVFDDNEKVASVCKNLYYSYHKLHGTEYLVTY